jgi:hypothetical protein
MAKTYAMHKAVPNWVIEMMGYAPMSKMMQAWSKGS